MLVRKLCQQYCPERLIWKLGECRGDGSDGQVFDLMDDPTRVIKFSMLYRERLSELENINEVFKCLIVTQPHVYARIYEYQYLGTYARQWSNGLQEFALYYYIMDKLLDLTRDEREVFDHFAFCEESVPEDWVAWQKGTGLEFDIDRVKSFLQAINDCPIKHNDLHDENIMKNRIGEFKLIDMDRCTLTI